MAFSEAGYQHSLVGTSTLTLPVGKVVCVGRNFADHARELANPIPKKPLLFIKPTTAIAPFSSNLKLSPRYGVLHYETEVTVLIGERLCRCNLAEAQRGIVGLGIGLDLTLREVQNQLKAQGHPWERAKAFDGSCLLSTFIPYTPSNINLNKLAIRLWRNNQLVQHGNSEQMLFPILSLLEEISDYFTLLPGDVVMTGTPKGAGVLEDGDQLIAELDDLLHIEAQVTLVEADDL